MGDDTTLDLNGGMDEAGGVEEEAQGADAGFGEDTSTSSTSEQNDTASESQERESTESATESQSDSSGMSAPAAAFDTDDFPAPPINERRFADRRIPDWDRSVPYVMGRDGIEQGRGPKVGGGNHRFKSLPETEEMFEEAYEEMNEVFNVRVTKADFNEMLIIAGLMNLGDVMDVAQAWGYTVQHQLSRDE